MSGLVAVDPNTQEIAWHCGGPDAQGACPRIAIGEEVPCIGKRLVFDDPGAGPYLVPELCTLCLLTLAAAMGTPLGCRPI